MTPTSIQLAATPLRLTEAADWLHRTTAKVYASLATDFKSPLLDKSAIATAAQAPADTMPCSRPTFAYSPVIGDDGEVVWKRSSGDGPTAFGIVDAWLWLCDMTVEVAGLIKGVWK